MRHRTKHRDRAYIQQLTLSYSGSQKQQEQTKLFLVMFDGFSCSCGLPHGFIHIRLPSSWFFAIGKAGNSTLPSKLFGLQLLDLQDL